MKKKVWEKPKLVVLTRGEREEAVLTLCKHRENIPGSGPLGLNCLQLVGDFCHEQGNT